MNQDLMANFAKQNPNYIHTLKLRKKDTKEKKKEKETIKSHLLNLDIVIKGEEKL